MSVCVCVFCVYTVPENLVNPELGSDYFGDSRFKVYGFRVSASAHPVLGRAAGGQGANSWFSV